MSETRLLAQFVAGLTARDVPNDVGDVLKKALIDAVGCGLHGLTTEWGRMMQEFAQEEGGTRPEAALWATGGASTSALNAALAHGTAVHSFDFDDHSRAKIHPGAVVIPAALALAERTGASGQQLLTAIAAGYEVMTRVSLASNPSAARMRGWHLTGTTGTFGAAAAGAVLLGLDEAATASALGLAGTQSAGTWAFNSDGAMSKRFHPGRSAQSGLMAALLAARGYHGPRMMLEAEDGGFLSAMSDAARPAEIGRGLGQDWRTLGTCFKPYACCGSNHSCIDAALLIAQRESLTFADIARVELGLGHVVTKQTGFVYHPTTVLNAQMSIRYDVAVALADRSVYLEQFTEQRIKDRDVCDLAERTSVVFDAEMDAVYPEIYAGKVTIALADGRSFTQRVDYSKGMPENTMSLEEIERKYRSLASFAIGEDAAESLLAPLHAAFDTDGVSRLARALGAVRISAGS